MPLDNYEYRGDTDDKGHPIYHGLPPYRLGELLDVLNNSTSKVTVVGYDVIPHPRSSGWQVRIIAKKQGREDGIYTRVPIMAGMIRDTLLWKAFIEEIEASFSLGIDENAKEDIPAPPSE